MLTLKKNYSLATIVFLFAFAMTCFAGCAGEDSATSSDGDIDNSQEQDITEDTDDLGDVPSETDGGENVDQSGDSDEEPPTECTKKCVNPPEGELLFENALWGVPMQKDIVITSNGSEPVTIIDMFIDGGQNSPFKIFEMTPDIGSGNYELRRNQYINIRVQYTRQTPADEMDKLVVLCNCDVTQRKEFTLVAPLKGYSNLAVGNLAVVDPPSRLSTEICWEEETGGTSVEGVFILEAIPNELGTTDRPLWVKSMSKLSATTPYTILHDESCPEPPFYIDVRDISEANLKRECRVRFDVPFGRAEQDKIIVQATGMPDAAIERGEVTLNPSEKPECGVGVSPDIAVEPMEFNFGYVQTVQGLTPVLTDFIIESTGEGKLFIASLTIPQNNYGHFAIVEDAGLTDGGHEGLAPGESATITIAYDPSAAVNEIGQLKIESNSQAKPSLYIPLYANAVDSCPPGFASDPEVTKKCIPSCQPGDRFCYPEDGSNSYIECIEENQLADRPEDCEPGFVCKDGVCQEPDCTPGKTMCTDLNHEATCLVSGVWGEPEECETLANQCRVSECRNGETKCRTYNLDDGLTCDDGNPCTLVDACQSGVCLGDLDSTDPCHEEPDNPCTLDTCHEVFGCQHDATARNGRSCDDGNACTINEQCQDGACSPRGFEDCDDDNQCTDDSCNPDTPEGEDPCTHEPNSDPCMTPNLCTINDVCEDGECVEGDEKDCADDDQCTYDYCMPSVGCKNDPDIGASCDDGNPDTIGDQCAMNPAGQIYCRPGSDSPQCDDGIACTLDTVCPEEPDGCCHVWTEGLSCDDGDKCTINDSCTADGGCAGEPKSCDDFNVCTDDSCAPTTGACLHSANTEFCDDGDPCTLDDRCQNKQCLSGLATIDCNDDNDCTRDNCNGLLCSGEECQPDDYCEHTAWREGEECDADGNSCTLDRCASGVCVQGQSELECPADTQCIHYACDPEAPAGSECIETILEGEACDDGDPCTENDTCSRTGVCQPGMPLECDDGDACKDWYCQPGVGCKFNQLSGNSCDDGDPCTTGDTCVSGACAGQDALDCSDDNVCTLDSCDSEGDPSDPCVNTPQEGASCEDGNPCTTGDTCDATGVCQTGAGEYDCSDGNQCTGDSCNPEGDPDDPCEYTDLTGEPCDDGDPTTENDTCQSAYRCEGEDVECNKAEICNGTNCDASCVETEVNDQGGCDIIAHDEYNCSDSDPCTTGDHCDGGFCVGSGTYDCDDGNVCTAEICNSENDPGLQCEYTDYDYPTDDVPCTSDGNECTYNVCDSGFCWANSGVMEDEPCTPDTGINGQCTYDKCNASGDCTHPNKPNGTTCDDDNLCTGLTYGVDEDACVNGVCSSADKCDDGNPCTDDSCNPATGACTHVNNSDPCTDDGNSCTNDYCIGGVCEHPIKTEGVYCDYDGTVPECHESKCNGSGECSLYDMEQGVPCEYGTTVPDCKTPYCDGAGSCALYNMEDGYYGYSTGCPSGYFCESGSCVNKWSEPGACPGRSDMVRLIGYKRCIDKYEAVICNYDNGEYDCRYQDDSNDKFLCWSNEGTGCAFVDPTAYSWANTKPSRWVTYDQAKKACEHAGKHLCSDDEWESACQQASTGNTYPYGNSYSGSACNDDGSISDTYDYTLCNYSGGGGPYDMSGNVEEWVTGQDEGQPNQNAMGGHYSSSSGDLTCTSAQSRTWDDKDAERGFRCCDYYP